MAESAGDPDAPYFHLLAPVSPIQWDNVTLYGAYNLCLELVQPWAIR